MTDQAGVTGDGYWAVEEGEQALERCQSLINTVSDGIYQLDTEGRFTAVDDGILEMTGHSRDDLLGEHVSATLRESDVGHIEDVIHDGLETDPGDSTYEIAIETATGNHIPCELHIDRLVEGDEFAGTVGVVRDITERKERQHELEESQQRYRTLAEHFPNGAVGVFDEDLRYTLVDGPIWDEIEPDPSDLEGEIVSEALPSPAGEDLEALFQTALEEGKIQTDLTEFAGRIFRCWATPVTDEDGDIVAGLSFSMDVTEQVEHERQLEQTKQQLETLIEILPIGIVVADKDGSLVQANDYSKEIWGGDVFDAATVTEYDQYRGWWEETGDVVSPDEWTMARVLDGETVTEPDVFEIEAADGERRTIEVRGRPIRDTNGDVVRGVITQSDITERKADKRKLEESERRYRTLVEHFPNGAVGLVDEDLRYRTLGGRPEATGDVSAAEAEGTPVAEAVAPKVAEEIVPRYEAALRGESESFELERNGRIFQFQVLPVRDDDGEVFGAMGMSQDITDRREYERQLEESERRYRTLVESFPNGSVGLFNEDLEYIAVGGQLLDTLSIAPAERIGKTIPEIHSEGLVEEIEPYFQAALEGEANDFELEFRDRHLNILTLPVESANGGVDAGMIVVQDVTERRKYERRLEESNERLEQFAYAASHDLQEPLRMISSYLQLIERRYGDDLDEEAEEFLEFASDGADRMRGMIDALLEYSRVETSGDPFEPVDLEALFEEVQQDLRLQIDESGAEITVEGLPRVEGDASQLRQVLQNLLENAIEYSGDDPPRVRVSAERTRDELAVSVEDEGIGIDPQDQERIFEVFQRLHSRADHEGTGIGLALCERIIERHDGDIWVDSEPGQGSTFIFTLPAVGSHGT